MSFLYTACKVAFPHFRVAIVSWEISTYLCHLLFSVCGSPACGEKQKNPSDLFGPIGLDPVDGSSVSTAA